jgi:hypothetical protein
MYRLALLLLLLPSLAFAADTVTIVGGKADATNVVVTVPAPESAEPVLNVTLSSGAKVLGQVVSADFLSDAKGPRLQFVAPAVKAGETLSVTTSPVKPGDYTVFRYSEEAGKHVDLLYGDRKVMRSMNARHDATSKDSHELTFKPFHHVFDPATGKVLLTNGAGHAADKSLQFPHHRGLFMGWMSIKYGANQTADNWHGRDGVYTEHEKTLATEAGPVVGRQRSAINWYGKDGLLFAEETREVGAYNLPGGTLIEFASLVTTKLPKVTLDGDPQHAGFHFRAAMETATKYAKETYYLRLDGKDLPGKTRNWDPKTKQGPVNLPWNAMSFKVADKRYTAVYLDRPENPKEARFSERDYGRFGSYFVYDITPTTPLKVKYRLWIQEGEMSVAECENLSRGFTDPPRVK